MTVIRAWTGETVLEFIAREGAVTTYAVATRFGWDMRRALDELNKLHRQGAVTKHLEPTHYCRMNGWRIAK